MHFKKLGSNESKYAESFRNIVSQYNRQQLKVIIAVLPDNVKEVLSETSPEYQELAYKEEKNVGKKPTTKNKSITKPKKGTSEKLLEVDSSPMLSRPVVVPTTMKENMYMKIDKKKNIDINDIEEDDDLTNIDDIIEEKPKKRGRPRKNPVEEPKKDIIEEKPKKRGRPRKNPVIEEEKDEAIDMLPGFDESDEQESNDNEWNSKIEEKTSPRFNEESTNILPGFDDEYDNESEDEDDYVDYDNKKTEAVHDIKYHISNQQEIKKESFDIDRYDNVFDDEKFESLLTGDKKVVAFVGTSKNGTSFIVNNVAQILSSMGINIAILDATQNKNAYYIYTKNDEELRKTAVNSLENLISGVANGVKVNNNLTVYTNIPSQSEEIRNSHPIMETLVKNHSLILIDCDFNTPVEYFEHVQELYLIQSMDVLTIQPLTEFLRELKTRNILDETKIRIILNKILKVRGVTGKNIVGGMSNYNDPEMSFMTELFDRNTVKVVAQIPFDTPAAAGWTDNLNSYPKEFRTRLNALAESIYPLLPNSNNINKKNKKDTKKGYNQYSNSFSLDMNNTLNNMRNRY